MEVKVNKIDKNTSAIEKNKKRILKIKSDVKTNEALIFSHAQ